VIPVEALTDRVTALPALGASVAQLARLVHDPDTHLGAYEAVVRTDVALTANLLRLANSGASVGAARAATVRDAIARLGTRRVWEAATAAAFGRVLPKALRGYDVDAVGFWRHSVAVAVYAEAVAKRSRIALAASAFTAGLLHDMGKLVIADFLDAERTPLLDRLEGGELGFIDAETELLGTNHALVGEAVARRWALPEELASAARWHHAPGEAATTALVDLASAVHVADALAHLMGFGADIAGLHRRLDADALRRLDLDAAAAQRIAALALTDILELGRSLRTPGGAP
jgi:putative nucleotidyltransferase with HDIG domain